MEAETLKLLEISYSDLMLLSSQNGDPQISGEEQRRLESMSRTIMETLGPSGPGLLSVTGVPNAASMRARLLPLARRLALLNHDDRNRILKISTPAVLPLQIFQTDFCFGVIYSVTISGTADVGEIGKHERLLDDRFFLICKVQERFRVTDLIRTHPYLVAQEHNLGSDVPLKNLDRIVSSFAMQLKYVQGSKLAANKPPHSEECELNLEQYLDVDNLGETGADEFKNLGKFFRELGMCMMELGLCLARVCDRAIGGQELEQNILESFTAKGRLIHYHSTQDNIILKEAGKTKVSNKKLVTIKGDKKPCLVYEKAPQQRPKLDNGEEVQSCGVHSNLWQQWHYDYGIFTVLTAPLFLSPSRPEETEDIDQISTSRVQECPSPTGHSFLQIYNPSENNVLIAETSPESFIIQVGESADILSKGKLRATLHSVTRPAKFENLSRETFVVFLQPAWSKTFSLQDYPMKQLELGLQCLEVADEQPIPTEEHLQEVTDEIRKIVPPLLSRLKDGMTFADFSRETTKQYYGGSGLQSNR